jgi:choline transport protein
MPIYELWRQATGSTAATTAFLTALVTMLCFVVLAVQQTASRMTWAFARDYAVIGAGHIGKTHATLEVPVWALVANSVIVFLVGCIYLGSLVAFNAIIGSSIILQMVSFAIPIALLLVNKRPEHLLPDNRPFKLPSVVAWIANITVVVFALIEIVFFCLPPAIPVTSSTMSMYRPFGCKDSYANNTIDYACAVLAVTFLLGLLNWMVFARTHYVGPVISLHGV